MRKSVNRLAEHWRVELAGHNDNISRISYHIARLSDAWE